MTEVGATLISGAGIIVASVVSWLIHQIIGINSRMAGLEQLTKDIRDQLIRMNEVSDARDIRNEKRLIR